MTINLGNIINTNSWISTLIFNKLSDTCPALNLKGADHKLYDICREDFRNYMLYINGNHIKIEDEPSIQEQPLEMVPTQEMPFESFLATAIGEMLNGGLQRSLQDTVEISEFLDAWISWWWRKWTERTKIILNTQDTPKNTVVVGNWITNGLSPEERGELMKIVIDKLVQYGEICCTHIIADSLIKKAVEEMKGNSMENKLQLISRLQRQAKLICYTHGVLVFIRPENYFKLGEWRNDGGAAAPNTIV